jgi:hypothetical protein
MVAPASRVKGQGGSRFLQSPRRELVEQTCNERLVRQSLLESPFLNGFEILA